MRKFYYSIFTVFALLFSINIAQAQLFEDFESGEKRSYVGGSVSLSSGSWYLEETLIGNLNGDKKNDNYSARMAYLDARIEMEFDLENAGTVSFYYGSYTTDGNNGRHSTIKLQQSTDGGSIWTDVGDQLTTDNTFREATFDVNYEGNIRFRIYKTSGNAYGAGDNNERVSIDDIRVTEFIVPEEQATVDVFVDEERIESNATVSFASTLEGTERTKTIELKNRGNENLVISDVQVSGAGFTVSSFSETTLAFNESTQLTLTFAPENEADYSGTLTISSNAVNGAEFAVNLQGEGFKDGGIMAISDARQLPLGSRVTVAGRVTVANQFDGPVSFQDATGGLSAYWPALHTEVTIGDSVVITGPLTEFNPIDGPEGDFMLQIGAHAGDDNITFEVFSDNPRIIEPEVITAQQMNEGGYESQLVLIQNVTFSETGVFSGESNVEFNDGTADALLRVDGDADDIVGASIPTETLNIVGVVDQFNGDYQLKPRFAEDLSVEEVVLPGEDISLDQTLDVVTWNVEWFGSAGNEPEDDELQLKNIITVIDSIDADLYALQEVSNPTMFARLVDSLDGYGGILADFSSQTQETAFLFNRATIDSLDSDLITLGMDESNWGNGRFPLMFQFTATINDESREIYAFTIHAKAMSDASSYDQRYNASRELKAYLDNFREDDNVILLGDFNDTMTSSITSGKESPYKNFVEDSEYTIVTKTLEEKGFRSQSIGSFIDHIMFTSELSDEYFAGTERVENTSYIGSYLSTTSDHYPVWTRFEIGDIVSIDQESLTGPTTFNLSQNYPNPFNPTTVISYQLSVNSKVNLEVFDIMGRRVATLVSGEVKPAGVYKVTFDASALSSGVYIYRLSTAEGLQMAKKMILLK